MGPYINLDFMGADHVAGWSRLQALYDASENGRQLALIIPFLPCGNDKQGQNYVTDKLLELMGRLEPSDVPGWQLVGVLPDETVQQLFAVDDVLYARMNSGFYRSDDKGTTWKSSFPRTDKGEIRFVSKVGAQVVGINYEGDVYFEQLSWKKVTRVKLAKELSAACRSCATARRSTWRTA